MPNYFTYAGFKLCFWFNELDDPIYVHVSKRKPNPASTLFNIEPDRITVEKAPEKNNLWQAVEKQEKIYGSVSTPEQDWGKDVGEEDLN